MMTTRRHLIDNESERRQSKFRKTNTDMNLAVMKHGLIKPRLDSTPHKIMIEPIKLSVKFSLAAMRKPEAAEIIAFRGNPSPPVFSLKISIPPRPSFCRRSIVYEANFFLAEL